MGFNVVGVSALVHRNTQEWHRYAHMPFVENGATGAHLILHFVGKRARTQLQRRIWHSQIQECVVIRCGVGSRLALGNLDVLRRRHFAHGTSFANCTSLGADPFSLFCLLVWLLLELLHFCWLLAAALSNAKHSQATPRHARQT